MVGKPGFSDYILSGFLGTYIKCHKENLRPFNSTGQPTISVSNTSSRNVFFWGWGDNGFPVIDKSYRTVSAKPRVSLEV